MLVLEAVEVRYGGVRALHAVSLVVRPGEIVALLGPNGAGKTTTLRAISGVVATSGGRISWQDQHLSGLAPEDVVRRGVAHVPEGRQIFPELTVEENLLVGSYARRDRGAIGHEIDALLARFPNLAQRRRQPGANLSGGEQQMLAIARALMAAPALLLLDEPSMGLAPRAVRQVLDVVRQLNLAGVTVLLVEQNARLALGIAQRGYLLEGGRVTLSGDAAELRQDPRLGQSYLGYGLSSAADGGDGEPASGGRHGAIHSTDDERPASVRG